MISHLTNNLGLKMRYMRSFLARRLVHVNLQLLYTCNFRCGICDFWKPEWHDKPRLSVAQCTLISEQLAKVGPQIISIGGGEPTLHEDLPQIVQALARHHFPVMITNGSRMTEPLARDLWKQGMLEISVSLDYADAEKHDAQRNHPGAFDAALRALRLLHTTRTHPEQRVNLITVVLDDNIDDIERLIEKSGDLGISYLLTLYSNQRGDKPKRPAPEELSRRLLELKRRHPRFVALRGYLARFSDAVENGGIGPCQTGRNLCNIDSTGQVSLCIDRLHDSVGNILTEDMHVLVQRLRALHASNTCQHCWTSCRGSIESLMYGPHRLRNLIDYHHMTRPIPLGRDF